jgi:hypothetical protein
LARRTRRDLSDKRVRKFIHQSHKGGSRQSGKQSSPNSSVLNFLKPVFYLFLLAFFIFIIYQLADSLNFSSFFDGKNQGMETSMIGDTASSQGKVATENIPAEEPEQLIQPVPQKIQVEVLNGCGAFGVAKKTTDYLRNEDIDVVSMGNYKNFTVTNSMVIDRIGDRQSAEKIAKILGISTDQIKSEVDESKQLAASIVIGKDYKKLKPFKK